MEGRAGRRGRLITEMPTADDRTVALFHAGPPKSGTTWIYRCLREHPQVAAPPKDSIHYFDMHHDRGLAWYLDHFDAARPEQRRFDPTPSYLRCPWAPARIAAHNPRARIAVCLRHPVERAFSHYWHEKKKGRVEYDFREILVNYDLFSCWLEPGLYAEHLERFFEHFPRGQVLVQRFEILQSDPAGFLRQLLAFFELETEFTPAVLGRRVNVAGPRHDALGLGLHAVHKGLRLVGLGRVTAALQRSALLSGRGEYVRGIPDDLAARLAEICEPEIARLEKLLGIDLSDWHRMGEAA